MLKNLEPDIAVVYHIGINGNSARSDVHGFGRAVDFGGVSKALPTEDPKAKVDHFFRVALTPDVDFFIFWHWGQVTPWDPATTLASDDPKTWKRLPGGLPKSDFARLRYRLLPPLPAGASEFAAGIFQAVHTFAVHQYQDRSQSKQAEQDANKNLEQLKAQAQTARTNADKIHADKLAAAQAKADSADAAVKQAELDGKPQSQIDQLKIQAAKTRKDAFAQAEQESKPALDDADKKEKAAKAQEQVVSNMQQPSNIGEKPSFVLHPDFPTTNSSGCTDKDGKPTDCKDGREAHVNHIHYQIGQTHTKTPFV